MFNFKKLKLVRAGNAGSISSFVGIRRGLTGELEFTLPKGFNNFPDGDFNATKKLFFRMYKTFKHFESDQVQTELDKKPAGKDNIETDGKAYTFKDSDDNDVIIYSKISLIENMLEAYRDLSMDFIEKSIGKSDKIDYQNLHKYLDRAIYLDENSIFIDEMDAGRYIISYKQNTLLELFCFIVREIEKEFGNFIEPSVNELADFFVDQNLSPDQSLFEEDSFESTLTTLKDVLHEIDKNTAYKDGRYWHLFEAIESFLYGELNMENIHDDGVFWGISNFFQVWEDMCNVFAFKFYKDESILFSDTNIMIDDKRVGNYNLDYYNKIFKKDDISYPFFIDFRNKKRYMRPDFIVQISSESHFFQNPIAFEKIKESTNNTVSFEVRLLDKSQERYYKSVCNTISKEKNNGARVKIIDKNKTSFSTYSKDFFYKHKNLVENLNRSRGTKEKTQIFDWKYMELSDFYDGNSKIESDVTKQLCYEFCLSKLEIEPAIKEIESVFAIPCFYEKEKDFFEIENYSAIAKSIVSNKIKVYAMDFSAVQESYIENDKRV